MKFTKSSIAPFLLLYLCLTVNMGVYSQIGVGTTTPHPSAMLHISAGAGNNKGLIIPKISSGSRVVLDSTQNIAHGLIFFDTDLQKYYYFHQSPRQWFELDHDWIRKDVAGASPVVGTHIYSGVPGNVGIGTAANVNPGSKLTVVGNAAFGSASWTQDSVAPNSSSIIVQTWVGIGLATRTAGGYGLDVKSRARFHSNVLVDGNVTATKYIGEGVVPTGGIIMWSGTVSGNFTGGLGVTGTEYEGWALCDGRNGTPDLRGRFVVGLTNGDGNNYGYTNGDKNFSQYNTIGKNGGVDSIALTTAQMPTHTHTGNTDTDGSHDHSIGYDDGGGGTGSTNITVSSVSCSGCGINGYGSTVTDGWHSHQFTTNSRGLGETHENRPPYYVLAYIIKL